MRLAMKLLLLLTINGVAAAHPQQQTIAGYASSTSVLREIELDLDQSSMEVYLGKGGVDNLHIARAFYERGAFSSTVAEVTLDDPNGLTTRLSQGTVVSGEDESGEAVIGTLLYGVGLGENRLKISYANNGTMTCNMGGLVDAGTYDVNGCLKAAGTINIENGGSYVYHYSVEKQNKHELTLQKLSTEASEWLDCPSCPYRFFDKFLQYYEVPTFGDYFITAAFSKSTTAFARGNADFRDSEEIGIVEAIREGTVALNVLPYVTVQMEYAVTACLQADETSQKHLPAHFWDKAVAFYSGSLEGSVGRGAGKFVHAFSYRMCKAFHTCEENDLNDLIYTPALDRLLHGFDLGKRALEEKECITAQNRKNSIEHLLTVPYVQGTLLAAFHRRHSDTQVMQAQGATFAAVVLPFLHACSPNDAEYLYETMKVGSGVPDFRTVKKTLERNYECMGLVCEDIGGVYHASSKGYYAYASPCIGVGDEGKREATALWISMLAIFLFAAVLVIRCYVEQKIERRNVRLHAATIAYRAEMMMKHETGEFV